MSKALNDDDFKKASAVGFFKGLPIDDIARLLQNAVVTQEEKSSLLFSQGDKADRFYIILEGSVKLYTQNDEGEESLVEIFKPTTSFAEAAMFASGRFPVNGETVQKSRIIRVDAGPFLRALKDNPQIGQTILKKMAVRYRRLVQEIIQLKTQTPAQRLSAFFLSLAEEHNAGETIQLPYDKNLIAARIGMKPESLSRALVRLRAIGVTSNKRELIVKDIQALRNFCANS